MAVIYTKCKTCGAELKFDPSASNWTCEYCGTSYTLDEIRSMAQVKEDQDAETKRKEAEEGEKATDGSGGKLVKYRCSFCGAEVVTSDDTAATFCVYCQRPILISDRMTGDFNPDGLIPFSTTKKQAMDTFRKYTEKKPFLPDNFRDETQIEKVSGIYVPFWIHDCDTAGRVAGTGEIIRCWSDSDYEYTETSTYRFERQGTMNFTHIPTDAAERIDNAIIDSIEPFRYEQLVPFEPAYLAGFLAEKYSEDEETCYQRAAGRALGSLEGALRSSYSKYSGVLKSADEQQITEHKSQYVLMPVWMLYTQYEEKPWLFAMNGQTGKFIGDLPIDRKKAFWKSLLAGVIGFVGSGALAALVIILMGVL